MSVSRKRLTDSHIRVTTAAKAALEIESNYFRWLLEPAEKESAAEKSKLDEAAQSMQSAREALRAVELASQSADSAEIAAALTSAQELSKQADDAHRTCMIRFSEAQSSLTRERKPIQALLDLNARLASPDFRGDYSHESLAQAAAKHAKAALQYAQVVHPGNIQPAEIKLANCQTTLDSATKERRRATTALGHMKTASQATETEPILQALEAASKALEAAQTLESQARMEVSQAEDELKAVLKPLQHCVDLCEAVQALQVAAEIYGSEKRAEQQEESDRAARERESERVSSPCECTEHHRCWHCISQQNGNLASDDPFR